MADLSEPVEGDDLDLDYGELGVDPNADTVLVEAPRYERSGPPPYAVPGYDWAAYFRRIRAAREAEGTFDAGGRREVIEAHHDGAPTMPPTPRRLVARLTAELDGSGWEVRVQETRVQVGDRFYVGSTETHAKGDLRTAAHVEVYWGVQGVLRVSEQRVAAFWATWTRNEGATKPGNKFESAVTWDAALGTTPHDLAGDFAEWLGILTP